MKRRFLLKAGAASMSVLAGTSASWVLTRTPKKALAPWDDAMLAFEDSRLACLAYAILAPSPHNRQPWKVELIDDNQIDLYCDLERRLPHTDPYDRQVTIGLGCFIEQLKIAAEHFALAVDITFFPEGEPLSDGHRLDERIVASIKLKSSEKIINPLFNQLLLRRSTKEAFDPQQNIEPHILHSLIQGNFHHFVGGSVESNIVDQLTTIIYEGMNVEFNNEQTLKESTDLMRLGKHEIEKSPDGIDLGGPLMDTLIAANVINREQFYDKDSAMVQDYLKRLENVFNTSKGFSWIVSETNTRMDQLQAGSDYLKLNLQAGLLGLAVHPVSQSLQEYDEIKPLYQKVYHTLNVEKPSTVQMLLRIGYAKLPSPSPRWPVESILL